MRSGAVAHAWHRRTRAQGGHDRAIATSNEVGFIISCMIDRAPRPNLSDRVNGA